MLQLARNPGNFQLVLMRLSRGRGHEVNQLSRSSLYEYPETESEEGPEYIISTPQRPALCAQIHGIKIKEDHRDIFRDLKYTSFELKD